MRLQPQCLISTALSCGSSLHHIAAAQMSEKLSTDEILAAIRGGAAAAGDPAPVEPPAPSEAAPESEPPDAETTPAPSSGPAPSSTADILAAARVGGAGAVKPAAGTAPKSTSDILAAVRGGTGGTAVPATAKKVAPAAVAPAIDEAAVSGLSVSEMIQAARVGQSPDEATVKKIALPSKPLGSRVVVRPVPKKTESLERRRFFSDFVAWVTTPIVLAWTSFCATLTVASLATARFMMPNVLVEPPTRFKIGPPTDYSPGTVSTKWKAQFGVWIVNAEVEGVPMVYALSTVCTHLGCTPNWLDGEQKFKCPCHGSGFRKTGVNFEGPAPRPLERMGIRLAPDGMLEVDKSVKFQQELGQWESPASYVPVV